MAGTITHNYILYKAFQRFSPSLKALMAIKESHQKAYDYARENQHKSFRSDSDCALAGTAYVGACGPDLFYLEFGVVGAFIADLMHYNKTGLYMIWALRELKRRGVQRFDPLSKFYNRLDLAHGLAYCLGHIAHVAADITIHPFVNSIVRAYPEPDNRKIFKNARGLFPKALWKFHNVLEQYQDAYVLHRRFQDMEGFSPKHWENANVAQAGAAYFMRKENRSKWFLVQNAKRFYLFTRTYSSSLERDKYRFFLNSNWFIDISAYYGTSIPDRKMTDAFPALVQGGTYGADRSLKTRGVFDDYLDLAIERTLGFWREAESYLSSSQSRYDDPWMEEDKKSFPTLRRHWNLDCGLAPGVSTDAARWPLESPVKRKDTEACIAGSLLLESAHSGARADVKVNL